ncbi:MAG: NUDIX hydrolase [Bacteroidota bacterium]|nr:NUDIX hydrolase [Bacteroidota bacterium]
MHNDLLTYQNNPWKVNSSKITYENPWIKVVENQVTNPAGNPGIYGIVHFKNVATGVVALDKELNIYLVGQYRFPLNEYSWEIPEGGSPIGKENPLETAKRELLEEAGLIATKWTEIGKIHTSNSVCDEVGYIYLAEDLTQNDAEPEETEELQVKKVSLAKAVQMVINQEITDGISMTGILIAARLFKI